MSDPRWWRNLTLLVILLGAAVILGVYATRPVDGLHGWRGMALVLAATAVFWGAVSLPFTQRSHRRDTRLRRGDGVLARWTVSPTQWQQFVANETRGSPSGGSPPNLVLTRQRVSDPGIEVIIGTDAIIVGAEWHPLTGLGRSGPTGPVWVASQPPTLEYHVVVIDATDTLVDRVVRVPVAPGHEGVARGLTANGHRPARASGSDA